MIAGLVAINPEPMAINGGNDAQAQPMSNVPAFVRAKFVLNDHRGVRRDVVGRSRADNDQIDIFGFASRAFQRFLGRRQRKIRRSPIVGSIKALGDARTGSKLVDNRWVA